MLARNARLCLYKVTIFECDARLFAEQSGDIESPLSGKDIDTGDVASSHVTGGCSIAVDVGYRYQDETAGLKATSLAGARSLESPIIRRGA